MVMKTIFLKRLQYDKRTPGLFKKEETPEKMICLCSKMYCCSDLDEKEKPKLSCKGIQKDGNNVNYQNFIMYYLINIMIKY